MYIDPLWSKVFWAARLLKHKNWFLYIGHSNRIQYIICIKSSAKKLCATKWNCVPVTTTHICKVNKGAYELKRCGQQQSKLIIGVIIFVTSNKSVNLELQVLEEASLYSFDSINMTFVTEWLCDWIVLLLSLNLIGRNAVLRPIGRPTRFTWSMQICLWTLQICVTL